MKRILLISLINILLLVTTCFSAEAKVSIGLSSSAFVVKTTKASIDSLERALTNSAGETVTLRLFDNDETLTNWLLRFQEIDAAIVSPGFISQQPAGTLSHLADLHPSGAGQSLLALTVRLNSSNSRQEQIKKAFLSLQNNSKATAALNKLGLAGVTLPGKKLSRKVTKKPQPQKAKTLPPKTAKKAQPVAPKPAPVKAPVTAPEKLSPATGKETPPLEKSLPKEDKQAKQTPPTEPKKKPTTTAIEPPAPDIQKKTAEGAPKPVEEPSAPKPATETKAIETKQEPAPKKTVSSQPAEEKVKPEPATNKRIILFVVLIILAAIIVKILLFVLRWQNRQPAVKSQPAPDVDAAISKESSEEAPPKEPIKDEQLLVIEEGKLGPGKVPELLKRCADLPRPVVLKAIRNGNEKLIYFAGGQVSGAVTHNTTTEPEVRWQKLGNLLVREKLITSEERDQGMALLTEEPDLRLGEALLKLNFIDLDGLRLALTKQAKVTIYSLILFPEGHYQVIDEASSLPPEESVSLEIKNLIREASHHQSEWMAIRQTLPNLNKKLEFSKNGQEKLNNVSLSTQQEQTLVLVDGKRTINDLCKESSMLDYEVYRFLYLMVKTGVLQ